MHEAPPLVLDHALANHDPDRMLPVLVSGRDLDTSHPRSNA